MSSFGLRLLALATMLLDHLGLALFPRVSAFRMAGRLSFPLVCFLLAEGARHTRSRRAYALRLLMLALLCEAPYDLLRFGQPFSLLEQNVGFSLLLSLGMIEASDRLGARWPLALLGACLLAMGLGLSYGLLGPVLCWAFYASRRRRFRASSAFVLPIAYAFLLMASGVYADWVRISLAAPLAALPILAYNGQPGPRARAWTLFFYAAIPAHLIVLVLLRMSRIVPPWFL